jgi:carbonic anhydrase
MKLIIALSLCLFISLDSSNADDAKKPSVESKHWGYRNRDKSLLPKDWYLTHPKCYGKQQSPINIELDATTYDDNLNDIKISSQFKEASNDLNQNEVWILENNGHGVVLTPKNKEFSFIMTPENQKYKMLQMHFHWRGSEHFVNGHKFSAELHLVHQNVNDTNKFAVLGFLFKVNSFKMINLI